MLNSLQTYAGWYKMQILQLNSRVALNYGCIMDVIFGITT